MRQLLVLATFGTLFSLGSPGLKSWAADGPAPPAADRGVQFFESKVRPVLLQHCYDCHGPEVQESGLRLDQAADMFRGGKAGPALVPGRPEQSLLITAIGHQASDLRMPPEEKLPKAVIADLTAWVKMGAPHPDRPAGLGAPAAGKPAPTPASRDHWAYQPIRNVPLPKVAAADRVANPIDLFILRALEDQGLTLAPAADRRLLIRRLTFDLIGLPPTPNEVADFLADHRPDAYARLVDRLLAAPQYGERWGRRWLDVARYADSNGLDENVAHGNAWRYRDYVVAALNADLPIDEFFTEQLAGDLLPSTSEAERRSRLIATGFLSLGPKVLAEVDETKMEMDIVDEQIDTVGRALLGMTLGCARCHDHKFDPVSTADYYALAGVFRSTKTMDSFTKIARWHEHELPTPEELAARAAHEQQVAAKRAELAAATEAAKHALIAAKGSLPEKPEAEYPPDTKTLLKRLQDEIAALEKARPPAASAMGVTDGKPADVAVHVRGQHLTLGDVVSRGAPAWMTAAPPPTVPADQSGRRQLAGWLVSDDHPLTARVFVNRVWRGHFGRGLVGTVDYFGQMGDRPSHPDLLDWLARRFQQDGWSLKALHRLIVTSAAYQAADTYSSLPNAAALAAQAASVDPENRLYHRWPLRRLEAEELRDAFLAVAADLDTTVFGKTDLPVENRKHLFDHTSKDGTGYRSPRRSLYLPVVRNNLYDVFTLFDFGDANTVQGDRVATTIAPQALYLMNSDEVAAAAEKLARRVLAEPDRPEADRLRRLYDLAYTRPPTAAEIDRALRFLGQFASDPAPDRGWMFLAQAMLCSNEFIYVR